MIISLFVLIRPILQLSRLPSSKGNTKATKLKTDLLSAFDTLTSHLVTKFSALSTALAKGPRDLHPGTRLLSAVIYGVHGLEKRIWGKIDSNFPQADEDVDKSDDSGDDFPEDSEDDDDSDGENGSGMGDEDSDRKSGAGEDDGDDDAVATKQENLVQNISVPSTPPYQSYAEEQRFLQNMDRTLARVLASADANNHGISNEMAPSQTHILLRAPRCFIHPACIPRQNLMKQMDNAFAEFLYETWPSVPGDTVPSKKKKQVGVWTTGRGGLGDALHRREHSFAQEDDEMIWWSWDGKLVGFADW
ncbi:hypothetical protein AN958_09197 [Leucoagaricus sp. SymC.cos]|nr:hypothetical protein AN958_09197 [Leucoagaricus sp. SymC.cos]